jgi:hypothetical protein
MAPKDTKKKQMEGIVVSAQQSRFHVDASDTPTSKEVIRLTNVHLLHRSQLSD